MKKTRTAALIMAFAMALTAASCGGKKETASDNESAKDTTAEVTTEASAADPTEGTTEDTSEEELAENMFGSTADINDFVKTTDINPPLWKVTDPESGNSIYLLGTMHVLPEKASDYPEKLMDIYNNCEAIAVEYDTVTLMSDANAMAEMTQGFIYKDGSKVTEHISDETYQKLKDYFNSMGGYSEMLDMYNTGFFINQLNSIMLLRLENLETSGTDTYFMELAKKDNKEVISIETLDTQVNALSAYSDDLADYILSDSLDEMDNIDEYAENIAEIYELWANGSGDIMFDSDIDTDDIPEELKDDYDEYKKTMLNDRNKGMAEKASELLKDGKNCLFMVGALHYSEDVGVDNLLEGMGYKVEKIA